MKMYIAVLFVLITGAFAFGLPETPDVPDVDVPDIEIPGLEILDSIQVQLDELISATDSLEWLIPELSALDEVSAKLEELRDTDPDIIGLQEQIDALRSELVVAREEMVEISDALTGDVQEMRASIDTFVDGLPLPTD